MFSEPGECPSTEVIPGVNFTLWDRWEIRDIGKDAPLSALIEYMETTYDGLKVGGVFYGVKMLYNGALKMHAKRLKKKMSALLKIKKNAPVYVDLVLAYQDNARGPPVRFYM